MTKELKQKKITKKAKKAFIRHMLSTNDKWLVRALHRVADKQTEAEYRTEETHDHNDVGFSASDASILTSFAKQHASKNFLSEKQMLWLRKLLVKYAGQVVAMSDTVKLERAILAHEEKAKELVQPELL